MSSSCGSKMLTISNAVKTATGTGKPTNLLARMSTTLLPPTRSQFQSESSCRRFSSSLSTPPPTQTTSGIRGRKKVVTGITGRKSASGSNLFHEASMSSWLKSSRVVFVMGSGGNGDGDNCKGNDSGPSRRSRSGRELGETSLLRQEGHNIDEVPVAVLKSDSSEKPRKGPPRTYVDLDPSEENAFIEGFSSYNTPQQVLKMLDTVPSQEVTPFVSFSILKKLFELENNFGFRNEGRSWLNASDNSTTETFTRLAIVTRLTDTILTCEDTDLLLDTLDLLRRESPHVNDQTQELYDPDNHMDYRNKVLQEILVRVTEGKLELGQVCRAVVILGKMEIDKGYSFNRDFIDKFWVGILDRSDDINSENVVDVLRTVKYFKKSSRLVFNLVERKMVSLWWKMNTETVAEICSLFLSDDKPPTVSAENFTPRTRSQSISSWQISTRLLMTLVKCTNLNIHKVTEAELAKIVKALYTFNFYDTVIEQALSKYMKAKCLKIAEPQLVAIIMDYARKFRLRSSNILEGAAEFVISHDVDKLTPPQLTSILRPFGELDFQPSQGPKFWEAVENYMSEKFIQFPPNDIVMLLLSCVCLMKYPLNFVDRTFSPYFLDRLHMSEPDFVILQQHRSNLKLLDTVMTIECKSKYGGPMLPRDFSSRTIFIDGRILRIVNVVKEILSGTCKNSSIDTSMILPALPLNALFTADILLTTPKMDVELERTSFIRNHINSHFHYQVPPPVSKTLAKTLSVILVHLPEHYSSDGKQLIGFQSLRKRLLKSLGFNVISLRYMTLNETKNDLSAMSDYVSKKLEAAVNVPL